MPKNTSQKHATKVIVIRLVTSEMRRLIDELHSSFDTKVSSAEIALLALRELHASRQTPKIDS